MESQHLDRLRTELAINLTLIDDFTTRFQSFDVGVSIINSIEEALGNGSEVISVSAGDLLALAQARNIEAETSVLDGLVRSGGIEVIRDEKIVAALAAWERSIRDYIDLGGVARTTTEMLLLPALHNRTDTTAAFRLSRAFDFERVDREFQIPLKVDAEIKGLIAQKTTIYNNAGIALIEMRQAAQSAVDAIDGAQAK
jgi:hypothetical protein